MCFTTANIVQQPCSDYWHIYIPGHNGQSTKAEEIHTNVNRGEWGWINKAGLPLLYIDGLQQKQQYYGCIRQMKIDHVIPE